MKPLKCDFTCLFFSGTKHDTLELQQNTFRNLTLKTNAHLKLKINSYNQIYFFKKSLHLIQFSANSSITLEIENSATVVFRSGSFRFLFSEVPSPPHVSVRLRINNVREVFFESSSFSDIEQGHSGLLQIEVTSFVKCSFGNESFSGMRQAEKSTFLFKLKGQQLAWSQKTFNRINQNKL